MPHNRLDSVFGCGLWLSFTRHRFKGTLSPWVLVMYEMYIAGIGLGKSRVSIFTEKPMKNLSFSCNFSQSAFRASVGQMKHQRYWNKGWSRINLQLANLELWVCRLQMYRVSKHWIFAELFVFSCFYFYIIHCILLTERDAALRWQFTPF